MIYNFLDGITAQYFKKIGRRPNKHIASNFQLIKAVDFTKKLNLNQAKLAKEGAYVLDEYGARHAVYFFKNPFWFYSQHHEGRSTPKFHIIRCTTIKEYGINDFSAANTKEVTIRNANRNQGQREYTLKLSICGNCVREVNNPPMDTEVFFERLREKYEQQQEKTEDVKVNLNGYTLDWPLISKQFKQAREYTCESCKLQLEYDRRYMEVHHRDRNKTNNHPKNLQCLCKLCHAFQDTNHTNHAKKGRNRKELIQFVQRYYDQLQSLNNPFLERYNQIFSDFDNPSESYTQ